jgi:hypothetical protein
MRRLPHTADSAPHSVAYFTLLPSSLLLFSLAGIAEKPMWLGKSVTLPVLCEQPVTVDLAPGLIGSDPQHMTSVIIASCEPGCRLSVASAQPQPSSRSQLDFGCPVTRVDCLGTWVLGEHEPWYRCGSGLRLQTAVAIVAQQDSTPCQAHPLTISTVRVLERWLIDVASGMVC